MLLPNGKGGENSSPNGKQLYFQDFEKGITRTREQN